MISKKLFYVNTILILIGLISTLYNSIFEQGEHFAAAKSYVIGIIFLISMLCLWLNIYRDEKKSYLIIFGSMSYALISFILFLEGALIV